MSAKAIQAPVGGINSYDAIDDMSENEAVFLDNWIPDAGSCRMRGGSRVFADTGGTDIGTLVSFSYSGGNEFLCCVDDKILDITGGVVTSLGSGFGDSRWDTVVFSEKVLFANGIDAPQQWDGTTLAPINFTGGITSPEVVTGINVYQGRVYYWSNQSTLVYYGEAGGYAGNLGSFDLSFVAKRGGTVAKMFTWSMDAGDGLDDFAVFLMTTGEALVYRGTDPDDVNNWALVGRYKLGQPLGSRCTVSVAGDEIILTRSGWESFKAIVKLGEGYEASVVRNISGLSRNAARDYSSQANWEALFYPAGAYILINIPVLDGVEYRQHILNSNTGAWSTLSGWKSNTFGVHDQSLFFGSNSGIVYEADVGVSDDGDEILTDALPAYNYLSGRANNKQLTGIRVITTLTDPNDVALSASADYQVPPIPQTTPSSASQTQTPWGSAWGSPYETTTRAQAKGIWQSKNAFGYALSYRMAISSKSEEVLWLSTQLMFRDGGLV